MAVLSVSVAAPISSLDDTKRIARRYHDCTVPSWKKVLMEEKFLTSLFTEDRWDIFPMVVMPDGTPGMGENVIHRDTKAIESLDNDRLQEFKEAPWHERLYVYHTANEATSNHLPLLLGMQYRFDVGKTLYLAGFSKFDEKRGLCIQALVALCRKDE